MKLEIQPFGAMDPVSLQLGVGVVAIRECFEGLTFVTSDGEQLSVCMRDSGFEVLYRPDDTQAGAPLRLNRGVVELIADNDYPPRTDPARTEKGGLNDYNEDRP